MKHIFDCITLGTAVRDIVFFTDEAVRIDRAKNPLQQKLLGFEFGAKVRGKNIQYTFGGGATNTAINFSHLGLRTAALFSLGRDTDGDAILLEFKRRNVNTQYVERVRERTGMSLVVVDTLTREHTAFVCYGANEKFRPRRIPRASWIHVSSLASSDWTEIIRKLKDSGSKISWNPGHDQLPLVPKYAKGIEVLLVNRDEATEICLKKTKNYSARNLVQILSGMGSRIAVVTDGPRGVFVGAHGKIYFDKPKPHIPKDTTGAGDCFASTFIASLLRGKSIPRAMRLAILNTESLVMHPGAHNGLLSWKTLLKKDT